MSKTPHQTITATAKAFGLTHADIVGYGRSKTRVLARRAVCHALRADGMTLVEIGKAMHRDHTTVLHHLKFDDPNPPGDPTKIIASVCKRCGTTPSKLAVGRRGQNAGNYVMTVRREVALALQQAGYSMPEIGQAMGYAGHGSIERMINGR